MATDRSVCETSEIGQPTTVARTVVGVVEDDELATVVATVTTRRVGCGGDSGGEGADARRGGRAATVDAVDAGDRSVGTEICISSPSEITRRAGGRAADGAGRDEGEEDEERKLCGEGRMSPRKSAAVCVTR